VFDSTIRANLLLGKPDATEAELDLALRRAHLRDWVASLPDGLETLVGRTGASCRAASGALTIARRSSPVRPFSSSTSHRAPRPGDRPLSCRRRRRIIRRSAVLLITHRPEGLELVDEIIPLG
jgi:ABC-type transport system involved in cytochrome bd biosynthesis fused ATPase/permease subunit